jgi:hypothetical protein
MPIGLWLRLPATDIHRFFGIGFFLSLSCQFFGETAKYFLLILLFLLTFLVGNAGGSDEFDVLIIIEVLFLSTESHLVSELGRKARLQYLLPLDATLTNADVQGFKLCQIVLNITLVPGTGHLVMQFR